VEQCLGCDMGKKGRKGGVNCVNGKVKDCMEPAKKERGDAIGGGKMETKKQREGGSERRAGSQDEQASWNSVGKRIKTARGMAAGRVESGL